MEIPKLRFFSSKKLILKYFSSFEQNTITPIERMRKYSNLDRQWLQSMYGDGKSSGQVMPPAIHFPRTDRTMYILHIYFISTQPK